MRSHPITRFLAAAAVAAFVACAPPPGSTEEPTPSQTAVKNAPFTLEIVNPMPHTMVVSYQWSGQEPTVLGPVDANSTKRFTIPNRAADRITVVAQDEAHTHTVTKDVTLAEGDVTSVTLSQ